MLPVSALSTQLSCAKKKVVEENSFNELKTEKVKFFTQIPTKIFCSNVFHDADFSASFLFFWTILNVRLLLTWLPIKKRVCFSRKKLVLINAILPFKVCCNFSYKNLF